MKFKALDTETGEIRYYDCKPCFYCKKWLVSNPTYKYCQYCGKKIEPTPSANEISSGT